MGARKPKPKTESVSAKPQPSKLPHESPDYGAWQQLEGREESLMKAAVRLLARPTLEVAVIVPILSLSAGSWYFHQASEYTYAFSCLMASAVLGAFAIHRMGKRDTYGANRENRPHAPPEPGNDGASARETGEPPYPDTGG